MSVKLLTEHHVGFLSLIGGCRGSSETTLVKMPHCWKSHVAAHTLYSMASGIAIAVIVGEPPGLHLKIKHIVCFMGYQTTRWLFRFSVHMINQ